MENLQKINAPDFVQGQNAEQRVLVSNRSVLHMAIRKKSKPQSLMDIKLAGQRRH